MKNIIKNVLFVLLITASSLALPSCDKNDNSANDKSNNNNGNINIVALQTQISALPTEPLNLTELNTLTQMREEEKLARDVYITLYNKWGSNIFNNISTSEQTHMDAILMLLKKYNLPDPVGTNAVGVFTNPAFQTLYIQLVNQGNVSMLEAFKVGATIEDLDINDLQIALLTIDNQDFRLVYDNLTKGSRNHLRSFYKNILNSGGSYIPQYITQTEFDAIINSPMETGF
ncbi:MAG: DUF2202 domain-containing protein [Chitinophagaceae bacterium]|nr:DUF2202 domain-containing protein [Chitinophagaceae bacterium]